MDSMFHKNGELEQWGSGICGIFEEAKELNLTEPAIEEIGIRLLFTVYLGEPVVLTPEAGQGRDHVGTKLGLSQEQVKILNICSDACGIKDLMAVAGRSNRTKFRDQVLRPLLSDKLIEMTIPDKPSSRQKYRLTERGRAALKTEQEK